MIDPAMQPGCYLPEKLRQPLIEFQRQFGKLKEKRNQLIYEVVKKCAHPVEHVYLLPEAENSQTRLPEPPWLICSLCGLTEEGWGDGYTVLQHANTLDRPILRKKQWVKMRTMVIPQKTKRQKLVQG